MYGLSQYSRADDCIGVCEHETAHGLVRQFWNCNRMFILFTVAGQFGVRC